MSLIINIIGSLTLILAPFIGLNLLYIINCEFPRLARNIHLRREVVLGFALGILFCIGSFPILITQKSWIGIELSGGLFPMFLSFYFWYTNKLNPIWIILGTSVVAGLTFISSSIEPGLGIISRFPDYLLPVVASTVFAALYSTFSTWEKMIPSAFCISALGVLIGADLVRVDYLGYDVGGVGIIGGAHTLDLLVIIPLLTLILTFPYYQLLIKMFPKESNEPFEPGTTVQIQNDKSPEFAEPDRIDLYHARAHELFEKGEDLSAVRYAEKSVREKIGQINAILRTDHKGKVKNIGNYESLIHSEAKRDYRLLREYSRNSQVDSEISRRCLITCGFLLNLLEDTKANRLASLRRRIGAFMIDQVIILILTIILFSLWLNFDPNLGFVIDLYILVSSWGIVLFFYFVILEYATKRTPGKIITSIRIVDVNGDPPSLDKIFARTVGRFIELCCGLFLVNILFIRRNSLSQRIGDIMGRTIVINSK